MAKQTQSKMSRALQRRENIAGYVFMLPSLVFFLGFVIIPMFICIITSLTNGDHGVYLALSPDVMQSVITQLSEEVKKFQELGIKPLAAGLKSWEPMLKNSMAFVTADYLSTDEGKSFGEDYRNGEASLDGTWNEYLETWSQMITEGIYTTDMTGTDHDQALEEFATGKAAMFCSGPWDLETITSKNPDLKIDMMPFNGTKASDGWLIGGPGCGFAVNESSKNKDAAKKGAGKQSLR